MYKHFLITRFNIKVKNWNQTKSGNEVVGTQWLTDRFKLFETYCLPSVQNQSNQNFTWLVFFDLHTPEFFKEKISRLQQEYPVFSPVYIDDAAEFRPTIISEMQAKTTAENDYIITSRIDNDDLIHKDFIQTIQYLFKPIHNLVIDFRKGFQMVIEDDRNEIVKKENKFSPFTSIVEKRDAAASVFSREHKQWADSAHVTVYTEKRLWVTVVHPNNIWNAQNPNLKRAYTFNNIDFGVRKEAVPQSKMLQSALYNLRIDARQSLSSIKKIGKILTTNLTLRKA
ncbi:Putative rhamnosyl transferase [Cnuella takakiae]|uniref:Putative rhamnosyl transferase n=1 Tax=Cnuella takakiae TaxID=1302690 RepID=A0A1M5I650_9BACT|nr:glycosyltransferase [Cnuella takakiae]OLY93192.1 hypothetical protein BUE76_15820 [Cnuella takakiae]SHG23828.1 Putative rhamnosyl transferase [Cnuella takakiae]